MTSTVRVGLRRLYRPHGCALESAAELRHDFQLGEHYSASVILGKKPQFGIWTGGADSRYIVPEHSPISLNWRYETEVEKTEFAGQLLTEIVVSREIEIDEGLHELFEKKDKMALNEVMDLAYAEQLHLLSAIELLAGMIGLRVHRQFVVDLINENPVAWRCDGPQIQFRSRFAEVLDALSLTGRGELLLKAHLDVTSGHSDQSIVEAGRILGWLQRAWAEFDFLNKFLWLFIPIECILAGVRTDNTEQVAQSKAIRRLIRQHATAEKKELLALFNRMAERFRPSLEDRFAILAASSGSPSSEADVEAFREFNRIRNALIHRGETKVKLHVKDPDKEEVSALQDIAERYVSYALFGDFRVYNSRGRGAS